MGNEGYKLSAARVYAVLLCRYDMLYSCAGLLRSIRRRLGASISFIHNLRKDSIFHRTKPRQQARNTKIRYNEIYSAYKKAKKKNHPMS